MFSDFSLSTITLIHNNRIVKIGKLEKNGKDTRKNFPNVRFILCEPFVLEGTATCATPEMPDRYERFKEIYEYAKVVKSLADEYGIPFLPLQEKFNEAAAKLGAEYYAPDGVHPNIGGSSLIATEWMKLFNEKFAE